MDFLNKEKGKIKSVLSNTISICLFLTFPIHRGWDDWMASPTRWTWVWVNSKSWWWTGRPGMLRFMGSQRVGHDWATELNWGVGLVPVEYKVQTFMVKDFLCVCFSVSEMVLVLLRTIHYMKWSSGHSPSELQADKSEWNRLLHTNIETGSQWTSNRRLKTTL